MKLSREEIESKRTEKGGFTKEQLAAWGIEWPPPKGWYESLIAGTHRPKTKGPHSSERKHGRPSEAAAIKKLAGFLGAWGCQTQHLTRHQLIRECRKVFKLDIPDPRDLAKAITDIGPDARRMLVLEDVLTNHIDDDELWPAKAKIRWPSGVDWSRRPSFHSAVGRRR